MAGRAQGNAVFNHDNHLVVTQGTSFITCTDS